MASSAARSSLCTRAGNFLTWMSPAFRTSRASITTSESGFA
jgi:hypothetical protein